MCHDEDDGFVVFSGCTSLRRAGFRRVAAMQDP